MSTAIDHLVYATPDLRSGVEQMAALLGVTANAGGSHPGLGTCNALLALGPQCYLEIVAPDPTHTDFVGTRPFGIDSLDAGRLVTWAARRSNLREFVHSAKSQGVDLGEVFAMSRETPEGMQLDWELTFPAITQGVGVVPFLIDWGRTPHPAEGAPSRPLILSLWNTGPDTIRKTITY